MYKSYNFVFLEQEAANREIETLKEENSRQSQGKLLYKYLGAEVYYQDTSSQTRYVCSFISRILEHVLCILCFIVDCMQCYFWRLNMPSVQTFRCQS